MGDCYGPNKRTRAHSKKFEDTAKRDEVKAMVENMQMLTDQALDLTKTVLLAFYSFCVVL